MILLLLACAAKNPDTAGDTADTGETADSAESGDTTETADTGETSDTADTTETGDTGETQIPDEAITLFCGDPAGAAATAWASWLGASGHVSAWAWEDKSAPLPGPDALVVLAPDLPSNASEQVLLLVAHGGPVLGLGVGGARAYDGLGIGIGMSDGLQTSVDGLLVADGQAGNPIFAGITVPKDGGVTIWPTGTSVVGLHPAEGTEILAWDDRYAGTLAVILHADRYWYWGWGGSADGFPADLTADGDTVLRTLVNDLLQ